VSRRVGREVWVGLDWGDESHGVAVVEAEGGEEVRCFEVKHSPQGLDEVVGELKGCGTVLGVAVESSRHLVVIKLLQANFPVYPINPKVSKKWRESEKPQEGATDLSDAGVLAKNLCHRHRDLRELRPDDEMTRTLAMLCSDETQLIGQRTALVNKLIATLKMYYPQALGWMSDWTLPSAWEFILTFPTPEAFRVASQKKVLGFLKAHRIGLTEKRRRMVEEERKAPNPWPVDPALQEAKSFLAVRLCKQLGTLEATLREYRSRIEELFAQHPDRDIFSSLPGAGAKLAPRLLTMFGSDRDRYDNAKAVAELSGTVPATKKSGKRKKDLGTVHFRRSCNKAYRNDLQLFSRASVKFSAWARAFYRGCRDRGQEHNEALRNLGTKWVKIMFRMWQDRQPYDEAWYLTSLIQHGSPIIRLMREAANS
jgi:transposase